MQAAAAAALEHELSVYDDEKECYLHSVQAELKSKRDRMAAFLSDVGLDPIIPEAGYFMLADFSKLS